MPKQILKIEIDCETNEKTMSIAGEISEFVSKIYKRESQPRDIRYNVDSDSINQEIVISVKL